MLCALYSTDVRIKWKYTHWKCALLETSRFFGWKVLYGIANIVSEFRIHKNLLWTDIFPFFFLLKGTELRMIVHISCMKNYLLSFIQRHFVCRYFFFAFSLIHDCRIVSAFCHTISFADGYPFGLSSVTYASWASHSFWMIRIWWELSLAFDLITTISVVRGWRGPMYSKLDWLNYGFASDNYYRHPKSLNKRNVNLTLLNRIQ